MFDQGLAVKGSLPFSVFSSIPTDIAALFTDGLAVSQKNHRKRSKIKEWKWGNASVISANGIFWICVVQTGHPTEHGGRKFYRLLQFFIPSICIPSTYIGILIDWFGLGKGVSRKLKKNSSQQAPKHSGIIGISFAGLSFYSAHSPCQSGFTALFANIQWWTS